ncbi:hypothetical protein BJY54_000153 [Streptomyces nodosus]|nr:hypothetical protein [Streptomyces nodosus]
MGAAKPDRTFALTAGLPTRRPRTAGDRVNRPLSFR